MASSTDNNTDKGFIGNITSGMGKTLDAISPDTLAEKIKDPKKREIVRKALYIIYDLGIVLLAFGVISMMMGTGWNPLHWFSVANFAAIGHSFQNLTFMNMMTGTVAFGAIGVGLGFLVHDVLPKKAHRVASRVAAVSAPLLLMGGIAAIIISAGHTGGGHFLNMHFSLTKAMTSPLFYISLLLVPVAVYYALKIPDAFRSPTPYLGNVGIGSKASQRRQRFLAQQESDRRERALSDFTRYTEMGKDLRAERGRDHEKKRRSEDSVELTQF